MYNEDKRNYYNALLQYDENEDISTLVNFLMEQTARIWRRSLELAECRSWERRTLTDFLPQ